MNYAPFLPATLTIMTLSACDTGQYHRRGEVFRGGILHSAAYPIRLADGKAWQIECYASDQLCRQRAVALCPSGHRLLNPATRPEARLDYGPPEAHIVLIAQCTAQSEEAPRQ